MAYQCTYVRRAFPECDGSDGASFRLDAARSNHLGPALHFGAHIVAQCAARAGRRCHSETLEAFAYRVSPSAWRNACSMRSTPALGTPRATHPRFANC